MGTLVPRGIIWVKIVPKKSILYYFEKLKNQRHSQSMFLGLQKSKLHVDST